MKTVLFCNLPYAFSIFKPLADALKTKGMTPLWYMNPSLRKQFPYEGEIMTSIEELEAYESDAIFVCGNDVPFWLRGVKVQIFHGLAGEKKGHFRIRDYFDLYLTPGPYFTERFQALANRHQNFHVTQTGWSKLDPLFQTPHHILETKRRLLDAHNAKHLILYAPTFSPSLTSAPILVETIKQLANQDDTLILIKFHDKMKPEWRTLYEGLSSDILIQEEQDITPLLQMADLMISDTSSVVYEFLLLDKPVITYKSTSEHIRWCDTTDTTMLYSATRALLDGEDHFKEKRKEVIALYHPYQDGRSSYRIIEATEHYIQKFGIPTKRDLPLHRKIKMIKQYGASWRKLFR